MVVIYVDVVRNYLYKTRTLRRAATQSLRRMGTIRYGFPFIELSFSLCFKVCNFNGLVLWVSINGGKMFKLVE